MADEEVEEVISYVQTEAEFIEEMNSKMARAIEIRLWVTWIACILMFEYLFKVYLCVKQRNLCKASKNVPDELTGFVDENTFQRSRSYKMDAVKYQIGSATYYMLVKLVLLSLELKHDLFPYCTILQYLTMIHIGFDTCGLIFIDLPRKIYRTFVLHDNHGFNKQTTGVFIYELVKTILIRVITITSSIVALYYTNLFIPVELQSPIYFLLGITYMTIYSTIFLSCLRKYTSLADGPYKDRLEMLARSVEFPTNKLFILEESKKSTRSISYFYGFWYMKHIVISDTLLQGYAKYDDENANLAQRTNGCNINEAEGILAHELGHWMHNHFLKMFTVKSLYCILSLVFLVLTFKENIFQENFAMLHRILQLGLPIYFMGAQHFIKYLSRRYKLDADAYAVNLGIGYGCQLRSALIKIAKANLNFPILNPFYSECFDSEPTLLERIQAIDLAIKKHL